MFSCQTLPSLFVNGLSLAALIPCAGRIYSSVREGAFSNVQIRIYDFWGFRQCPLVYFDIGLQDSLVEYSQNHAVS